MDKNKRRNLIMVIAILVVIAAMVLSVFIVLTRRNGPGASEDMLELTDIQKMTSTDLESNYPASAPAVIDYYYRINKVLFEQECSQEEIRQLVHQEWVLFDTELQAQNPEERLIATTNAEVNQKKADGFTIASYVIPSAREINDSLTSVNGRDVVTADVIVTMRKGQVRYSYYYTFVLRKDADKRWKIMGFEETGHTLQQ